MPFKVLVTDYVWPSVEPERAVLAKIGAELVVAPDGEEDTLAALAKDVDGILTCFAQVTDKVVRAAENCVVIGRYGVGVDNIAVDTATELGIAVTYVPDYCVDEVSDHVMGLLLDWNRRISFFDNSVKGAGWGSVPLTMRIMRPARQETRRCWPRQDRQGRVREGAGVRLRCPDLRSLHLPLSRHPRPAPAPSTWKRSCGNQTSLRLHSPLTPDTENLIGEVELALMKDDSFLINCARGPLIDEEALYAALQSGSIGGAGLDVLVDAHPSPDYRLLKLDNVLVTPHVAFFSQEAVLELEERAAGEVASVLQGQMPDNLVNTAVLTHPNPRHGLSA